MPVELTSPKNAAPQKEWQITGRFVLVALVVFFAIVAGVNAVMMTMAIKTFSGVEARNGYDLSQAYNKEIARAREQAGRHWQSDIVIVRDGGPVRIGLTLKDAAGAPVTGLALEAQFRHPTDRRLDHTVALTESAAGTYSARPDTVASGVWSVAFTGKRDGERIYSADTRVTLN